LIFLTVPCNLQVVGDEYQSDRLHLVIEGHSDGELSGMLELIKSNQTSDSNRAYQCIKTLVNASNRSQAVKDYLLLNEARWQWAVNWLRNKMASSEDGSLWDCVSSTSASVASASTSGGGKSNEDGGTRMFRTTSAQVTLDEANAILAELGAGLGEGLSVLAATGEDDDDHVQPMDTANTTREDNSDHDMPYLQEVPNLL
jgi:hypothetical protein